MSGILVRSHLIELNDLTFSDGAYDADRQMAVAEIQSGLRLTADGSGLSNLSSEEWMTRWNQMQSESIPWDEESMRRWHRKRFEALRHDAPSAATWHEKRLNPGEGLR